MSNPAIVAAGPRTLPRFAPYVLPVLLVTGLLLRLIFVWVGAALYYKGNSTFINGDTSSYTESFLNLWYHGTYTHDPLNQEAAFGRLPGYPFFWGAHYLLFGEKYVFQAVAYSQCLLDTLAIYFIYATAKALTRDIRAAWLSALLYMGYPFVLVWITISGSESFSIFLTILIFWWLSTRPVTTRNALLAGMLVGMALMVREYLGILLLPVFFWLFSANGLSWSLLRTGMVSMVGFLLLYLGWPIRNYVFQHRIMPLKTSTAGYERYAEDVNQARKWIYGWTPDADPYLRGIAGKDSLPAFPPHVFATPAEETQARALFRQAKRCGTGFHVWRTEKRYEEPTNCNQELAAGFAALNELYKHHHPWRYQLEVPLLNLKKAFFKSQLTNDGGSSVALLLFRYRSAILLLSLWGAWLLRRRRKVWPLLIFFSFMYFFISFGMRQLEMRYLVQADAISLCLAGMPLILLFDRLRGRQPAWAATEGQQ